MRSYLGSTLTAFAIVLSACATSPDDAASSSALRGADPIECRSDRACPRGSYCEIGLGICFTSSRCYVNGRPSDEYCERLYGENFVCFEYGVDSHHCVPVEVSRPEPTPEPIECRSDRPCPRGSYCEPGLNICLTSSRCYVNGRPSDELCERAYGEDFACYEYAPGSHHCAPML